MHSKALKYSKSTTTITLPLKISKMQIEDIDSGIGEEGEEEGFVGSMDDEGEG